MQNSQRLRRVIATLKLRSFILLFLFLLVCPLAWQAAAQKAAKPAARKPAPTPRQGPPRVTEKKRLRFDEPAGAEEFYRLKRTPAGSNAIPVQRYFTALEHVKNMPRYTSARAAFSPSQQAVGLPTDQANGVGAWSRLGPGNIGGRTRAIVIHPTNPSTIYAASVAGGVWKTTNGGASWTPLTDLLANLAVCSLALDPTNPNVLYAGTGEGFFNGDGIRGAGIFKTTDGGANWTALASTTNSADFHYVNDLIVSPANSQRLYAATRTGVWRSLDGGATWTSVHDPAVTGGCLDLVVRTDQTTDYLFAACGTFDQASIYRNTDASGAGVWTEVQTEAGMGRTSLALAPSNQNVIYALSASVASGTFDNGLHAVFRSTGSGAAGTWTAQVRNTNATKLNTLLLTNPVFAFLTECGFGASQFFSQGWYDNVIAVDPLDANRVWAGGIDLFRSDDGGANWGLASYWWANTTAAQYAHADQHTIVFHPQYNGTTNKIMYVGDDGGVFRTDDARAGVVTAASAVCNPASGVTTWTGLHNGYEVTQFYHGLPYPSGASYFGGTQDNGTIRGTDAGGVNGWTRLLGGDGGYVAIDPGNINVLYAETTNLSLRKTTNGSAAAPTWVSATNGITEASSNFLFITPFIMEPGNADRLWIGGRSLWRTNDAAANWSQASPALTSGSISALAVAPSNTDLVLAGSSNGGIFRTTSGTTATAATVWTSHQTPRGVSGAYISWLAFDPNNASIAYATVSSFNGGGANVGHVFRSSDGGVTWAALDGSGATAIPDVPVHCLVVDPVNTTRLYVGTDIGVFVSTNGGASWAVENTGFASVVTEALALNVVSGVRTLFAFTHGRGAYRTTISSGNNCPSVGSLTPTTGAVGATVTISGAGFTGVTSVKFSNNVTATFTVNNDTQITATVPANAVTGPLTISEAGCPDVQTGTFTVTQAVACPTVTSLNPASGVTGSSVTLTGTNFTGVTAVKFSNNVTASFTVVNATTITATVPAGAVTGPLTISKTGCTDVQTGSFTICSYTLAPTSQNFAASGGTGSANVTAPNGCAWTATSNAGFITINSGATGSGNGAVNFTVAANTGAQRTGTLTVAGQTFTVTQDAAACTFTINPTNQSIAATGGNGSVSVTASQTACTWTATSNAAWLTITSGATGAGNGAVNFTAAANTNASQRSGTLTIAGQTFTVTQSGQSCSYTIAPTSQNFTASGGAGSVNVTAGQGCTWTAASNDNWLTINSGATGSGNGAVNFTVAANSTTAQRTGTLTIAGQTFTVTQAGANCSFTLSATSQSFGAAGGGGSVNVTASNSACTWTAASNAAWITITSSVTNAGNGAVAFLVAANNGAQRSGTLTVAGQSFTVTQSTCTFTIAPTNQGFTGAGGAGAVTVTTAQTCAWPVTSNANWITITAPGSSGVGPGVVRYTVAANTGPARTGTISICDLTFTVTQGAAACTYALAPASRNLTSIAGTGTVNVTAAPGCQWTAASNAPWLSLTSGASGTGNGAAGYAATANPGNARSGALTIAGQTFTVNQEAGNTRLTNLSAASFRSGVLAADSIAAAFGNDLATGTQTAPRRQPLPTSLLGTTVTIRDSAGVSRNAPLFFVSRLQVNYLLPAGMAFGAAKVTINSGLGNVAVGDIAIAATAPALFTYNNNGQGVPAGVVLRVRAGGQQVTEPLARLDTATQQWVAVPIAFSPANEEVFLVLYGSGLRNRNAALAPMAQLGGVSVPVTFAGPAPGFAGLDQLNIRLPRALAGRGEVELLVTVEGQQTNAVKVLIK